MKVPQVVKNINNGGFFLDEDYTESEAKPAETVQQLRQIVNLNMVNGVTQYAR